MTSFGRDQSEVWTPPVVRAEGYVLCTAFEALLKGLFECEWPVSDVFAPRRQPLDMLFRVLVEPRSFEVSQRHGLTLHTSVDATRAVELALRSAALGKRAVAFVPNDQLHAAMALLARERVGRFHGEGRVVFVLEDNPYLSSMACPLQSAAQLGLPCLAPSTVDGLRVGIQDAFRVAQATESAVALIAHVGLLRSLDTLEVEPNRVLDRVDAALELKRNRRPTRSAEREEPLAIARRLELNQLSAMPSPGETEPWGVVATGSCVMAIRHLLEELGLAGRVPLLALTMPHPLDQASLVRLLSRCANVVVLEPRPGTLASEALQVAEMARRSGEKIAAIWWDRLPSDGEVEPVLELNDATRPSILARKIAHILSQIRPSLAVEERLTGSVPQTESLKVPDRGEGIGASGAMDSLRSIIAEVAEQFASRNESTPQETRTGIIFEGRDAPESDRFVVVEAWDRRRFAREGATAVRQAARDSQPRMFAVCDLGGEDTPEIEPLARAAIPQDAASPVEVMHGDLNDRPTFRELLRSAALRDGLTIVIGRDGPPPRRDVYLLDRGFAEVDRMGFVPLQRAIWSAEAACDVRPAAPAIMVERGLERGTNPLRTEFKVEVLADRTGARFQFNARPLLEQVEVLRTKPPRPDELQPGAPRPAPPKIVHANSGRWRAHLAGWRGDLPGLAALALCEAGRSMGYRVQAVSQAIPVGPGRRAWSQVVFTSLDAVHSTCATQIPYGEADVVIGLDPVETVRALGPDPFLRVAQRDRTYLIANTGLLDDQVDAEDIKSAGDLAMAASYMCRGDGVLLMDVANICRQTFLTERLTDLVLLGMTFQQGLIPVSESALEAAVGRIEERGYGRCVQAVQYGRVLAAERTRLMNLPLGAGETKDRGPEGLARLVRRIDLEISESGFFARRSRGRFRALMRELLQTMAPLSGTRAGRAARRDAVTGLHRCWLWGGMAYAETYARLLRGLARADSGEDGWPLLVYAPLPLAEVMLIRDLVFVATMSTSLEQRRLTRRRLDVRAGRGDKMERRFLNRIEATLFGRFIRLDFRSSDWPAKVIRTLSWLVPLGVRGKPTDRASRDAVTEMVVRAAAEPERRNSWGAFFARLHESAVDGTLLSLDEKSIRSLATEWLSASEIAAATAEPSARLTPS
ncbi:MAG: 2-oxoacid:acceptor oxidoreductase family protein [Planctomycetes bacterium]|nr:2-oxoacid:acceptor oxidoreductase family protein [Planctomycetota bacterium]